MAMPQVDFRKLSAEESSPMTALISRALQGFTHGTQAAYLPQQLQADLIQKQAAAQKNMMMSQLLQSMMGGGEGGGEGGGAGTGGGNMRPAILKALTGVDPYLMSPQESQNLKIAGSIKEASNKANLTTGSSNIARETLQNQVSMPEEYMGVLGSAGILKDIAAYKLGDQDAKERLIKAGLAHKLIPEYAGFQLMSQGQRPTVSSLEHQRDAIMQGWAPGSKQIISNLPASIQKEIEKRHNKAVKEVNKTREDFFTSGGQERPDLNSNSEDDIPGFKWSDISHTAKQRGLTENQVVDRLAKKNNMTVDEFMNHVEAEEP